MIDLSKDKDDMIIQGYNKYSRDLARSKMGDKRRYNTKQDIIYNGAMLSIYEKEMHDRGLIK